MRRSATAILLGGLVALVGAGPESSSKPVVSPETRKAASDLIAARQANLREQREGRGVWMFAGPPRR